MAAAEPPKAVTTITGRSASAGPSSAEHVQAVAAGHLEVEQHGVGRVLGDPGQGLVAVGRLQGLVAFGSEEQDEVATDRAVVVGHQDRG